MADRRATSLQRLWFVAVTAVAVVGAGCASEAMSIAEFERAMGVAAPPQPVVDPVRHPEEFRRRPETVRPAEAPSSGAQRRSIGFDDGAEVVSAALSSLNGERSLISVTLYEGYGIVTAHEPTTGHVDRVVVRGNGAEEPAAVPSAAVREPEASRFAPSDVNWQIVPALVERTPGDLGVPDGTVSHVIVEKNIPFSPELVIRVYVDHPRSGGRIDYFAAGHPMRVFKD